MVGVLGGEAVGEYVRVSVGTNLKYHSVGSFHLGF